MQAGMCGGMSRLYLSNIWEFEAEEPKDDGLVVAESGP